MRPLILALALCLGLVSPATGQIWDIAVVERHGLATVSLGDLQGKAVPAPIISTLVFLVTWVESPGSLPVTVRIPGAQGDPTTFKIIVPVRGMSLVSETPEFAIVSLPDLQMLGPMGRIRGPATVELTKTKPPQTWTVTAVTIK